MSVEKRKENSVESMADVFEDEKITLGHVPNVVLGDVGQEI